MAKQLDIAQVEVRGGPLVLAGEFEVHDLERRLGTTFPVGYREYVTRLGEGVLDGLVQVLPPWRILSELGEHRGLMAGFWHWDPGNVPFDQRAAMESIPIADTLDGDVIAFHAAHPERVVVLPRDRDALHDRGPDMLAVIDWVCSGRAPDRLGSKRFFEPFDSRTATIREEPAIDDWPARSAGRRDATYTADPPRLQGTARDVLLAYFDELRAVEEWAIERYGGCEASLRENPPAMSDADSEELVGRSREVYRRYCTAALAQALAGGGVRVSSTAEHELSTIRILDETARMGRATIRTAEGTDDEMTVLREYVLEASGDQWRIVSERDAGFLNS